MPWFDALVLSRWPFDVWRAQARFWIAYFPAMIVCAYLRLREVSAWNGPIDNTKQHAQAVVATHNSCTLHPDTGSHSQRRSMMVGSIALIAVVCSRKQSCMANGWWIWGRHLWPCPAPTRPNLTRRRADVKNQGSTWVNNVCFTGWLVAFSVGLVNLMVCHFHS